MSEGFIQGPSQGLAGPVLVTIVNVACIVNFKDDLCVGDAKPKRYLGGRSAGIWLELRMSDYIVKSTYPRLVIFNMSL